MVTSYVKSVTPRDPSVVREDVLGYPGRKIAGKQTVQNARAKYAIMSTDPSLKDIFSRHSCPWWPETHNPWELCAAGERSHC